MGIYTQKTTNADLNDMEEDLKSLIKKAQDGNLGAFAGIVRQFQDMAVGYAYSILGDPHLAEDAAQEAFVEAYRCLSRITRPSAFPGWLRKVVFKHCDRLTRGKRVETIPLEFAAKLPSSEKGPDEAVLEQELKDSVLAAIQALPENQRVVTMLFYINQYSQNEISYFLGIPVTTIKKRLQYSRKRLKERMIKVVQDTLRENRPSRDSRLVNTVLAGIVGSITEVLRNPLDNISSIAQALQEHPDNARAHSESAQGIRGELQRASLIIENLLAFTSAREKEKWNIDLHNVLEDILSMLLFTNQMASGKVKLRKELHAGPPMVCGSPELLGQVFANLILNAFSAMPHGGTLTVTTRVTETARVEVKIGDTGEGISSEFLPKIFGPFFTTKRECIGLGLSVSRIIIQQHQGTIEVESQVGKGTTAIVTLPAGQEAKPQ
jgi:RNA polymerase sigma factor (sigma-70 family)